MHLSRRRFLHLGAGAVAGLGSTVLASHWKSVQSGAIAQPADVYNPPRGDVRLVVISDLNDAYGSTTYSAEVTRAIALLPRWQPDLVLCSGDMVAGQDRQLTQPEIEAMWNGFDRAIAQPLRQAGLPFGFTLGNHDASRAMRGNDFVYQQERALAATYWRDPAHDPGLAFVDRYTFPFYYTFEQNQVFYLVWDASSGLRMSPADRAWVEQSLGSERAQQAPLRIVIGHLPLYAVAIGRDRVGEVMDGAAELHTLLERYRVHTYISGHHHAYFPGHLGQLEFLHTGALGSGPRQLLSGDRPPHKTLTVVDINLATTTTTHTTFEMPALRVVNWQELPRTIVSRNGIVLRRDIQWSQLSTQEQQACLTRLSPAHCYTPS